MKKQAITASIIILSFLVSLYAYPRLPEMMATHWNAEGIVDVYSTKTFSLFSLPVISLFLFFLFNILPNFDPLKQNVDKFRNYYDEFVMVMIWFLFYLHVLSIMQNVGLKFNMLVFTIPAFGLVFYYVGTLVENAKRNWFIGIKTPWTLSDELVWEKTHKIGGKLYKYSSLITIGGMIFDQYAIWFILLPVILVSIYLTIYSYLEYQKVCNKQKSRKNKG